MALETSVLLGLVTSNTADRVKTSLRSPETVRRHMFYHLGVNSYGVVVALWINLSGAYGGNNTPWCYIVDPMNRIYFAYIPIFISFIGIVYLDFGVIRKVIWAYSKVDSVRDKRSETTEDVYFEPSGGGASAENTRLESVTSTPSLQTQARMNLRMIYLFAKMLLYPALVFMLLIPGFVLRMSEASGSRIQGQARRVLAGLQKACDPSAGIVLAAVWIIFDDKVLMEWARVLAPYTPAWAAAALSGAVARMKWFQSALLSKPSSASAASSKGTEMSKTTSNVTSYSSRTVVSEVNPLTYPHAVSVDSNSTRQFHLSTESAIEAADEPLEEYPAWARS
jgi:hypothetical protein